MVMHMLAAGGAPVVGKAPGYEVDQASRIPLDRDWLMSLGDSVVKVLDPHRGWRQQCEARVIWLDRDEREQAKSQVKFLQMLVGVSIPAATWKAMRSRLRSDRGKSFRVLPPARMMMSFEGILSDPERAARRFAEWFDGFDVAAAAAIVKPRSSACAPSMDMEVALALATQR
jgi:hypothetical protein